MGMTVPLRLLRPVLLWLVFAAALPAQTERDRSGGRALLYADANFRGDVIVLYPGDRIDDFGRQRFDNGQPANDRISSIRLEGPLELMLYAHGNYGGDVLRLTDSISNLSDLPGPGRRGTWNDTISSATVAALVEPRRPRWPGGTGRGDVRGPRVELYSDANYRGSRLVLTPGDRIGNLADVGFDDGTAANDRISSIRVQGGTALVVHDDAGFRGASLVVDESIPNLAFRGDRPGGRSWNDAISAIVVTHARAVNNAEELVTRAYRELLGRDPDAPALAHYAAAMRTQGYGEAELRSEIRRSREFRERDAKNAVQRAYREILRREADPEGLANFIRMMVDEGWSEGRVREAMRSSEEFRKRSTQGG
jgi:hypothetical protein